MFQGFAELADNFTVRFLACNSSGTPVNLDSLPTYRVYGPSGFITGQSGSLSLADSRTVTGATNASPISVTCAAHGFSTGDRVTIAGVVGNAGANGTFVITKTSDDTFTLDGSSGTGTYTSGGTANITGLYQVTLACTGVNGYEAGETYEVVATGAISSVGWGDMVSFGVT